MVAGRWPITSAESGSNVRGTRQLKVGLRVRDLDTSCGLYLRLGFRRIPSPDESNLRYLTFGHTWLILSDANAHGYHNVERERAAKTGSLGSGFVLAVRPRIWTACTSCGGARC